MHDHAPGPSCRHGPHAHGAGGSGRKMALAVALTLAFVVGEAAAGYFGRSLALLSDAGHNFADALALGLSGYALWIGRKSSCRGMTFGYHRVGILAALVNSVSLVMIALFIAWEAVARLKNPPPVAGGLMIVVAAVAVVVNLLIGFWLHAGARHADGTKDLNVHSAYVHMIGDAVSALGVVAAGVVVRVTGASGADPVVSLLIAALILYSSWGILKESVSVLLEATPAGIDMADLERTIRNVPGVLNVHDLHVWTVGSGVIACSCHVLVAEQSVREGQQVLRGVVGELGRCYGINHTTVQVEVEGCAADDMYCNVRPAGRAASHAGHHHVA